MGIQSELVSFLTVGCQDCVTVKLNVECDVSCLLSIGYQGPHLNLLRELEGGGRICLTAIGRCAPGCVIDFRYFFILLWSLCGGTVGAIFTCPLEVIKTRLQSSRLALRTVYYPQVHLGTISGAGMVRPTSVAPGLLQVLKSILEKEGPKSLFRGLGPNLVGVAPSRAVYFACYSKAKEQFNGIFVPNSNTVHIFSAGSAGMLP
ncbi:solute carrier family 25 member 33-like [Physeter macrocephalus]|uniref:Solute carrier family 25 member 33-like n=1 Tax=Physeter macrocephalus TaxID=9755 RepID=A0A455BEK7_PHYMC|nr:solute carrier family 25 member 33-like [Physeter catodon]|eukprot:XP_028342391.1 solute carrier family 25 member 33-like [Physeter catodon]